MQIVYLVRESSNVFPHSLACGRIQRTYAGIYANLLRLTSKFSTYLCWAGFLVDIKSRYNSQSALPMLKNSLK